MKSNTSGNNNYPKWSDLLSLFFNRPSRNGDMLRLAKTVPILRFTSAAFVSCWPIYSKHCRLDNYQWYPPTPLLHFHPSSIALWLHSGTWPMIPSPPLFLHSSIDGNTQCYFSQSFGFGILLQHCNMLNVPLQSISGKDILQLFAIYH